MYVDTQNILIGTYRLTVDVSIAGLATEALTSMLTGDNAEKILSAAANDKSEMTLPVVGKLVRFKDFQSISNITVGTIPINRQWVIDFELLENPIGIDDLIAGIAIVAGILAIYLTFRSIEKIADSIAEIGGNAAAGIGTIVIIGALGFIAYKFLKK